MWPYIGDGSWITASSPSKITPRLNVPSTMTLWLNIAITLALDVALLALCVKVQKIYQVCTGGIGARESTHARLPHVNIHPRYCSIASCNMTHSPSSLCRAQTFCIDNTSSVWLIDEEIEVIAQGTSTQSTVMVDTPSRNAPPKRERRPKRNPESTAASTTRSASDGAGSSSDVAFVDAGLAYEIMEEQRAERELDTWMNEYRCRNPT